MSEQEERERDTEERRIEHDYYAERDQPATERNELVSLKAALAGLRDYWIASGRAVDSFHATMGTGYHKCAADLDKLLSAATERTSGRNDRVDRTTSAASSVGNAETLSCSSCLCFSADLASLKAELRKGTYNCPECGWNVPHSVHATEQIERLNEQLGNWTEWWRRVDGALKAIGAFSVHEGRHLCEEMRAGRGLDMVAPFDERFTR